MPPQTRTIAGYTLTPYVNPLEAAERDRQMIQDAQARGIPLPQAPAEADAAVRAPATGAPTGTRFGTAVAVDLGLPKHGSYQGGARGDGIADDLPEYYRSGVEQGYDPETSGYIDKAGRFAGEALEGLNPVAIVKGLHGLVTTNPVTTIKNIGKAQGAVLDEAQGAYEAGDYGTAAMKAVAGVIPLLGLRANEAINLVQAGDIAGAMGATVDLASILAGAGAGKALTKAGRVGAKAPRVGIRGFKKNLEDMPSAERAAVEYGLEKGISLPRSVYSRGAEFVRQRLPAQLGAQKIAARKEAALQTQMRNLGDELRVRGGGNRNRVDEFKDHADVINDQLDRLQDGFAQAADASYGRFRSKLEGLPDQRRTTMKTVESDILGPTGERLTRQVPELSPALKAPVDVRGLKRDIKNIVDDFDAQNPGGAAAGMFDAVGSRALQDMRGLLNMGDDVDLVTLERALSNIKEGARRSKDLKKLQSYRLARSSIEKTARVVDDAAKEVGVFDMLDAGRRATKQKYDVLKVIDDLKGAKDGTKMMDNLLANNNKNLNLILDAEKIMPGISKQIGGAWMDRNFLIGTMDGVDTFGHGAKMWSDWNKLGRAKQRQLFDADLIPEYSKFLNLQKKLSVKPNPSATATGSAQLGVWAPLAIKPWIQAKMMYGPDRFFQKAYMRHMTEGLNIPITNKTLMAKWLADGMRLNDDARSRAEQQDAQAQAAAPPAVPVTTPEPVAVERMEL